VANWMDFMSNPRSHYIKKTMFEVLQEKYSSNEPIIERLSVSLMTEGDLNSFLKLIRDVYETAYTKAVEDHREQLKKAGLVARIVPGETKS